MIILYADMTATLALHHLASNQGFGKQLHDMVHSGIYSAIQRYLMADLGGGV